MTLTQPAEAMPLDQSTALAEFARACKSAARSVSLYPGTHPAIAVALSRVASASRRLAAAGAVTLGVHPDTLVMDSRLPGRPDPAISELAQLLHERLIGELRVMPEAASDDWHALLLILARAPEDVLHDGGVGKAWAAVGRPHLEIREIDYAEVLRERAGGEEAAWDRIIAFCLQGDAATLDDRALTTLLETVTDPDRLSRLIERLQASPDAASAGIGATAAALLQLLRTAVEAATARGFDTGTVLQTMGTSMARLTPEMLLAVLARRGGNGQDAAIASSVALVAVGPAHHRRGCGIMLVDPDGEETDHVGRQPLLALELGHRLMRRVDIHQSVVGLAVLLDAVGEGSQAPIFGLADRATALL